MRPTTVAVSAMWGLVVVVIARSLVSWCFLASTTPGIELSSFVGDPDRRLAWSTGWRSRGAPAIPATVLLVRTVFLPKPDVPVVITAAGLPCGRR
jgi:hypothetical protein